MIKSYVQLFLENNPSVLFCPQHSMYLIKVSGKKDSIRGVYGPLASTKPIPGSLSGDFIKIGAPSRKQKRFNRTVVHSIKSRRDGELLIYSAVWNKWMPLNTYYAKNIASEDVYKDFILLQHYPETDTILLFVYPGLLKKKDRWSPVLNEIRSGEHDKMLTFLKVKAVMAK
jgi:hypothetical protein